MTDLKFQELFEKLKDGSFFFSQQSDEILEELEDELYELNEKASDLEAFIEEGYNSDDEFEVFKNDMAVNELRDYRVQIDKIERVITALEDAKDNIAEALNELEPFYKGVQL